MAADYVARAGEADELADPDPGVANNELVDPAQDAAPKIALGRRTATGSKETVVVLRRPVGRPTR
jgi:hypothetical protein